ncbi:MAG: TAT-variant-translocated molybdopterin oxidoreductase, partial [Chitinophagales bacterium]
MAEKKYWKGLEELNPTPEFIEITHKEFPEELPVEMFEEGKGIGNASRRDFLKVLGFSLTAATVAAGCEMPVKRVAPYIFKPEGVIPGIATWYASTYINGGDYCSILVKTREGRPIKIEGNKDSVITQGGTSARAQASILSLYDTSRLKAPMKKDSSGKYYATSWAELDKDVVTALNANAEIPVRILTSTIISPSTKKVFQKFAEKYPNTKVYSYDAISYAGILSANEQSFGIRAIPHYHFERAKVIVSFDADFLGTWISPVEYTKGYIKNRKVSKSNPAMSRHYQIEAGMSLTGANADYRIALKPSEINKALVNLYNIITGTGATDVAGDEEKTNRLKEAAKMLKANMGAGLVVSGSNDINNQILVNAINNALGNYGPVISFDNPSLLRQGADADLKSFIAEINTNASGIAIIYNCNPVYDSPLGSQLAEAISKVNL